MENEIQAFIFDLDGVITDTSDLHFKAWNELASSLNINIDLEFNERLKGVDRMESLDRILRHGGVQDSYTLEQKQEFATSKNNNYKKLISEITSENILPGIEKLLNDIKNKGYKIGVASASRNANFVIERLGLSHFFDYIIDSSTVKNGKPNPEIFMKVAEYLEVPYVKCIGIEDAEAGIEAINAANMFSVGVGDTNILQKANYVVPNTNELTLNNIINSLDLEVNLKK